MKFRPVEFATALAFSGLCAAPAAAFVTAPSAGWSPPALQLAAYDATVQAIQQGLNDLGYDAGPADGLIGGRTRSAIRAYEQAQGLLVTGAATLQVAAHIRDTLSQKSAAGARDDVTADVQRLLRRRGYGVEVTGRMDAETRAAIEDYQRDSELFPNGQASAELREHLRENRRARSTADASLVADVQSELRQRGYPIRSVTGRMDDDTENAIRRYQRESGMRQTGRPSAELLVALRGPVAGAHGGDLATVKAVQAALNQRGYDLGAPDGALGPSTRDAIRTYQSDARLPVTGAIDDALLAKLGISGPAAGSAQPTAEYVTRISDDFDDGNFDRDPNWRVLAGEFVVRDGALESSFAPRETSSRDAGRALMENVLGQALGVQLPGGAADAAAIAQYTSVDNAFRVTLRVSGEPSSLGRLNLGLFQGSKAGSGYRLVYLSGDQRPLRLMSATGEESSVIASASPAADLADGKPHAIDWRRSADGRMTVHVDGALALDATDNRITGGFEGISLINGGGVWRLDQVVVQSVRG